MSISAEEIQKNWELHKKIIKTYISSPRKESILQLLDDLEEKIIMAPGSSRAHFHNAFPGGYVDHVNNVVKAAIKTKNLWEELGATIDFTEEELIFSAFFHDFGKIGNGELEGYLPQKDNWRRDKLGEEFTPNKELDFMLIQDRSLFLLQKYNIVASFKEYLAIRVHDGLYDDANKAYFVVHNPDSKFRTNLPDILHQADLLAARIEYNLWQKKSQQPTPPRNKNKKEMKSSEGLLNIVNSL